MRLLAMLIGLVDRYLTKMKPLRIANRLLKPLGLKVLRLKCRDSSSHGKWIITDYSLTNPIHVKYYEFAGYYPANFSTPRSVINFILKYIIAFDQESKPMCISNPYFNKTLEEALVISDFL